MKRFWKGFSEKQATSVAYKKHVILVFWDPSTGADEKEIAKIRSALIKHPQVKVKSINVLGNPASPRKHNIRHLPSIVVLRNGKEVYRLEQTLSPTVVEAAVKPIVAR